jgi:WD40 repeat protein
MLSCTPNLKFSPDGHHLGLSVSKYQEHRVESQDGNQIIKIPTGENKLVVLHVDSQKIVHIQKGVGGYFDWSPDGQFLLFDRPIDWDYDAPDLTPLGDGLWAADISTGEEWLITPPESGFPLTLQSWSKDGKKIAFHEVIYMEGIGPFGVADADGSNYRVWEQHVGLFDWSPNNDQIVFDELIYGYHPGLRLLIANGDGTGIRTLVSDNNYAAIQPIFSPDGRSIAFLALKESAQGNETTIMLIDSDGRNLRSMVSSVDGIWDISWSPGGDAILAVSQKNIMIYPLDGSPPIVLHEGSCPAWRLVRITRPNDHPVAECKNWGILSPKDEKDKRIITTQITDEIRQECRGAFRFNNNTSIKGFGGYTLELIPVTNNTTVSWSPPLYGFNDGFLLFPQLDLEAHAFPTDKTLDAQISLIGEMTVPTVVVDSGVFLITTAFSLAPPGIGCLIPEEQLFFTAVRLAYILNNSTQLALRGDFIGAREELMQVLEFFYERAGELLSEIGFECASDLLSIVTEKPVNIIKISVRYLAWIPVAIFDYFKYSGIPTYITIHILVRIFLLSRKNLNQFLIVRSWGYGKVWSRDLQNGQTHMKESEE